jgi:DNA integrity scanning protein DisA with diadenylate cyclase activity
VEGWLSEQGKLRDERALERLAAELADDVGLNDVSHMELEEILYAARPPLHEGKTSSYGSFVANDGDTPERPELNKASLRISVTDMKVARRLADGRTAFVRRIAPGLSILRVYAEPIGDELSMVDTSRSGVTTIQRTAGGQVRIFRGDRIIVRNAASRWWSKPTARLYSQAVSDHLPDHTRRVMSATLRLCVHQLSAANVGATIVQNLTANALGHVDRSKAMPVPEGVNVVDETTHSMTRSLLAQLDRAAFLSLDGSLHTVNVELAGNPELRDTISVDGGTRHQTAALYSASEPDSVVYVVSADGPVTVFKGGRAIATTDDFIFQDSIDEPCPLCEEQIPDDLYDEDIDWEPNPNCVACRGTGIVTFPHDKQFGYAYDTRRPPK